MAKSHNSSSLDKIKCPSCGELIPITEAIRDQLGEGMKEEMEKKIAEGQKEIALREREIKKKETEIAKAENGIDKKIKETLEQERAKLEQDAKKKAEQAIGLELKDVKAQLKEKDEKLEKAEEAELEFRKKERELDEGKKNLELEIARKVSAEKEKLEGDIIERVAEENKMKEAEKEKQISDLRKQIEILKRKAEQGSQQLQGEVMELELEDLLKASFPIDEIAPVPKGVQGADVLQKVRNRTGGDCGVIIWESKRTKNWSEGWIEKLKNDQRAVKAEVAVLVSEVLPSDINNAGLRNGVWVVSYNSVVGIATALRLTLTQVALTKLAAQGKDEKIEALFGYVTGAEFRQRVEVIVETFMFMKGDLDKEKLVFSRRWAEREKQIERVIMNTAGMYGDLQGLIGAPMQSIPALESGDEVEDEEEIEVGTPDIEEEDLIKPEDIPF